jgi:hypothetical protein
MIELLKKKIFIIYRFGTALGDQFLLTGVSKLIKKNINIKLLY